MPRKARVVVPNTAHHVIQRGNYQQYVFEKPKDFQHYLYWIAKYAKEYNVKIHAYCLMSNHVHFIVTPGDQNGMALMFKNVHMCYAQYKNVERKRLGHLWQGRFYSCVLSRTHLLRVIRYVEMNPVRAKMVKHPWEYVWSSTRQHIKSERMPIVRTEFHRDCDEAGLNFRNWKKYLIEKDFEMEQEIRNKTQKGLVIGSLDFIIKLEEKLGIVLRELKAGRPRKETK